MPCLPSTCLYSLPTPSCSYYLSPQGTVGSPSEPGGPSHCFLSHSLLPPSSPLSLPILCPISSSSCSCLPLPACLPHLPFSALPFLRLHTTSLSPSRTAPFLCVSRLAPRTPLRITLRRLFVAWAKNSDRRSIHATPLNSQTPAPTTPPTRALPTTPVPRPLAAPRLPSFYTGCACSARVWV